MDKHQILNVYKGQRDNYVQALKSVVDICRAIAKRHDFKDVIFTSRAKTEESLNKKLENKSYRKIDDVPDLIGMRVVLETQTLVSNYCGFLLEEFKLVNEHTTIDRLKTNQIGYRAWHFIIRIDQDLISKYNLNRDLIGLICEVQVHTLLHYTWSQVQRRLEFYKTNNISKSLHRRFLLLSASLERHDLEFSSLESFQSLVTNYEKRKVDIHNISKFIKEPFVQYILKESSNNNDISFVSLELDEQASKEIENLLIELNVSIVEFAYMIIDNLNVSAQLLKWSHNANSRLTDPIVLLFLCIILKQKREIRSAYLARLKFLTNPIKKNLTEKLVWFKNDEDL